MIMGFEGQASSWGEPFLERLRRHFTASASPTAAPARATKPAETVDVRTMADDAANLLDVLGIEQPHVLGISMGGMIAQEFVLAYPERVQRSGAGLHRDLRPRARSPPAPPPSASRPPLPAATPPRDGQAVLPALVYAGVRRAGERLPRTVLTAGLETADAARNIGTVRRDQQLRHLRAAAQ